jgi:short subunit dehydrogenase-like uncharacterized protein
LSIARQSTIWQKAQTKGMTKMTRPFDLILSGATGFVGQQAIAYLAEHGGKNLRWAVAARSASKLKSSLEEVGQPSIAMIVADAQDEAALSHLAAQTRVVLSCAGPYALYGSKLVAECVAHQTHYADITGETPWIAQMIAKHHAQAAREGTRIVPSCGFDSVPSDLGAHLMQREMIKRHGEPCTHIKAAFTLSGGGLNGGTLASMLNMIETDQLSSVQDLFLLNPEGTRPQDTSPHRDPVGSHRDPDFKGWLGLFFMGPINTRVVRRSSALRGQELVYQEYMRYGSSALAGAAAAGLGIGSKVQSSLMAISPLRKLTLAALPLIPKRFLPQPGQGPSIANMDRGFFKIELIATSGSGKKLRGIISDALDAGNRATVKMMCESALALALNEKKLPKAAGVITPSVAFGDVLEKRLLAAGMRVEVTECA